MGFLDDLSSSMLEQVGLAENVPSNLDHRGTPFGKLGDFAGRIDQTEHRSYVETGSVRNIKPRALEIISQEPDITVVIKKRIFSSLVENYRVDLMDDDEKLFLRATKRLFYNKCRQIAAYERLTKAERVVSKSDGVVSDFIFPAVFSLTDALNQIGVGFNKESRSVLETIRKVKKFSDPQFFTTWNIAREIPYATDTGQGTGTFDLTLVSQMSATNSVKLGEGRASLTIEDPYKLMVITNNDIEQAISDAVSVFKQRSFFTVTENQLKETISNLRSRLNSIRQSRGATRIIFRQNEDTILFKKIRATIDEEGREINFSFSAGSFGLELFSFDPDTVDVDPSGLSGRNGLSEGAGEVDLFKQIVHNMYVLIGLQQTTRNDAREFNKLTNPIRRKMQLHYGNKPIIQPMDVVYIYVSSKTSNDAFVSQGLKLNVPDRSIANALDETVGNIESAFEDIKATFSGGGNGQSHIEQEKNAIAGPDFPLWLWSMLRNDFLRQSAGTCVFVGIVEDAPHSYSASNGKYTLNVNVNDNSSYFKMGQINISPSVEVFNSALYDPLTPFKLEFDESNGFLRGEVPQLLDANVRLLNSRSIRAKSGRFVGSPLNENRFYARDVELMNTGSGSVASRALDRKFRRKFNIPDGFIYRWKEGIGSLVLFGEPYSPITPILGSFRSESSPSITADPLAGQDVMNALSLMITGNPYNFNNFMRGALDWAKINKEDLFNEDLSVSFFRGLINDLTRNNAVWGHFVPFKELIINERAYDFLARGEFDLIDRNQRLNDLLRERAEKYDELASYSSQAADSPLFYETGSGGLVEATSDITELAALRALETDIKILDEQINEQQQAFFDGITKQHLQNDEGTLGIFGDDISFDPTVTGMDGDTNETKRIKERIELRRRVNYLTQRRIWAVRGNEDANLFIVDDSYDKNYDIQAFEKALTQRIRLFESSYSDIFDKVQMIAKTLGLEVFADSQGHIRARPPQYNRMPSSIFRRMLQERVEKGIQIFPSYLERLFYNTIQGVSEQIEIVEDRIRLLSAAIGRTDDTAIRRLITSGNSGLPAGVSPFFEFLTEENTGSLNQNLRILMDQDSPELQEDRLKSITQSLNATVNFSIVKRADIINDDVSFTGTSNAAASRITKISNRLTRRTRTTVPSNVQDILSNDRASQGVRQSDVLRVSGQIGNLIAERQRLIKTLANSIKNYRQGQSVNDPSSSSAQSLLLPNLSSDKVEFPEMLEHMIEDEQFDDLGVNSGKRYVIRDSQVLSLEIVEKAPDYTAVQVDGKLATGLVDLPTGLNVGNGGNAIGTAWAVDYDLWRMYGFRGMLPDNKPFFSDPNTQCAPYAVFLLNLAREQVFRGNLSIFGNEFVQPGEVYYIDDRDLLFYSESVTHNYQYNGAYSTSMNLTYGHNPGEYIPTQLDIIGKGLYTNRHQADLVRNVRHERADDTTHLSVIVRDTNQPVEVTTAGAIKALVEGQYGDQNRKTLSNLMLTASGLLTPSSFGKVVNIELRVYKNSDLNFQEDSNLIRVANGISSWLVNPTQLSLDGEDLLPTPPGVNPSEPLIDPDRVSVSIVDLSPIVQDTRSPSSQAWSIARTIVSAAPMPKFIEDLNALEEQAEGEASAAFIGSAANAALAELEVSSLRASVIDVWITFNDVEDVLEGSRKERSVPTQSQQQEQEDIAAND